MLNRRLLRIKALQAIYAFKQTTLANQDIIMDEIGDYYFDQVSIEGAAAKEKYRLEKAKVVEYVKEKMTRDSLWVDFEPEEDAPPKAVEYVKLYRNRCLKEFYLNKERFIKSIQSLTGTYLGLLNVLRKLGESTQREKSIKEMNSGTGKPYDKRLDKLFDHPFLVCMRGDEDVRTKMDAYAEKYDQDQIDDWYKSIKTSAKFNEVLDREEVESEDSEHDLIKTIVRDFFFKSDAFISVFEEGNMSWEEDRAILKSLVMKTVKEARENDYDQLRLLTLSKDWEEDKKFFTDLYERTLIEEHENQDLIDKRSEKWATNRIASLDMIMINMGMTEIKYFSNIPVKVTINEYVDISKNYSTPKSWQFINGMLDNILKDMTADGTVRKSGRGLLDNK